MKTKHVKQLEDKKKEIEAKLNEEKKKLSKSKNVKNRKLKWFEFDQNNTGGSFVTNKKLCHNLYIQAYNYEQARQKALELGVYFDGVSNGLDCGCCGDRWDDYETKLPKFPYEQEVYIYTHYTDYEKRWQRLYGKFKIIKKPKLVKGVAGREFKGKIVIQTVEQYAQLMANQYGWTVPDVRIYYNNGKVKEIFKQE